MQKLLWVDMEMTGLYPDQHKILEVAAVVTDLDLTTLGSYDSVVHQTSEVLASMDDWCKKTHGESGLTMKVPHGKPIDQVEQEVLKFISNHYKAKESVILAGNSIHQDRKFIERYMPKLDQRLHYRMVDVSSFKQIFREKYGFKVEKKNGHRAVDDIAESIAELKLYLQFIHVPKEVVSKSEDKKSES